MKKKVKRVPDPATEDQDKRVTVSARNVSKKKWEAIRKAAESQGRLFKAVMDEMMDDWLAKHNVKL